MTITIPVWLWFIVKCIGIAGGVVGFFLLCLFAYVGWQLVRSWK